MTNRSAGATSFVLLLLLAAGPGLTATPALPPQICGASDHALPGCPPPVYIGDGGTEGECGGAGGSVFADNSTTDRFRRLVRLKLDAEGDLPAPTKGTNVDVLLPRDYASSRRRYPVLYLFGGDQSNQDSWFANSNLISFTDGFVGSNAAIIVTDAQEDGGIDVDWRDGHWLWESMDIGRLIPYIDSRFRTIPDRAHRAIAGASDGGYTAMHDAARHPDLFVAAGSFSGLVDSTLHSPAMETVLFPFVAEACHPAGSSGEFPDPVTGDVWWHNADPSDLAENLAGLSLYVASGNGAPCGAADVGVVPIEPIAYAMSQGFDAALTNAHVAHTTDFYGCGVGDFDYFVRDLKAFWPIMLKAFGRAAPSRFNYRTADSAQHTIGIRADSVYGWTFTPDPARATEFLDLTDVSGAGVTLTGSGLTTVTTARLFSAGERVVLDGATRSRVNADTQGRIRFTVNLGPAHAYDQFSAAERALEARGGYFATREVRFKSAPRQSSRR